LDTNIICVEFYGENDLASREKRRQKILDVEVLKALEYVPRMKKYLTMRCKSPLVIFNLQVKKTNGNELVESLMPLLI